MSGRDLCSRRSRLALLRRRWYRKSRDNDLNSDPYPTDPEATLISKSAGSTGSTENVEWELSVDDQTVFRCVNPTQENLYRATAEALHAYHEGLLADQISDIAPKSG